MREQGGELEIAKSEKKQVQYTIRIALYYCFL